MKSVKMTGIASKVYAIVHNLRSEEIKAARSFWMLAVFTSTIGWLLLPPNSRTSSTDVCRIALVPQLISPVAAFGIFAAGAVSKGTTLDITRLFTSLSLLILLTQPLFYLFDSTNSFASALGCFARVQEYLAKSQRKDTRVVFSTPATSSEAAQPGHAMNGDSLSVANGRFAWSAANEFALSEISFKLHMSQQLIVVGPVASGKSTLLKALLGELPISSGEVNVFDKSIAYCGQTPWISVRTPN